MDERKGNYDACLKELEELLAEEFRHYAALLRQEGTGLLPESREEINRLVEQLQYHDIIRQKIEHVRQFLEICRQDVQNQQNGQEEQAAAETEPQRLGGLLELSMALLRYTDLEYRDVLTQIDGLLPNHRASFPAFQQQAAFAPALQQLIDRMEEEYLQLETDIEEAPEAPPAEKLRRLWESFSMKSEREVFALFFEGLSAAEEDDENAEPEGQVELF